MNTRRKIISLIIGTSLLVYLLSWAPWMILLAKSNVMTTLETLPHSEVAIVFGGLQKQKTELSETNIERLLTAKVLLEKGTVDKIRISNTTSSAFSMEQFLIQSGVEVSKIEIDTSAKVTEDTCLSEKSQHTEPRSVIFISHSYHLPRLQYLCRITGLDGIGFPAETLETIQRTKLPLWETWWIRYLRYQQEAILVLMKMSGLYETNYHK